MRGQQRSSGEGTNQGGTATDQRWEEQETQPTASPQGAQPRALAEEDTRHPAATGVWPHLGPTCCSAWGTQGAAQRGSRGPGSRKEGREGSVEAVSRGTQPGQGDWSLEDRAGGRHSSHASGALTCVPCVLTAPASSLRVTIAHLCRHGRHPLTTITHHISLATGCHYHFLPLHLPVAPSPQLSPRAPLHLLLSLHPHLCPRVTGVCPITWVNMDPALGLSMVSP